MILESWLKVILNLGDSTSPIPWCEKRLSKTAQFIFQGFFGTLRKFKNAPNQGRVDCFLWFWDKFEQPYRWAGAPPRPLSLAVPLRGTTTNEQVEILMPQHAEKCPNMLKKCPNMLKNCTNNVFFTATICKINLRRRFWLVFSAKTVKLGHLWWKMEIQGTKWLLFVSQDWFAFLATFARLNMP